MGAEAPSVTVMAMRRFRRGWRTALLGALVLTAGAVGTAAPAQAVLGYCSADHVGAVVSVQPGVDLQAAISSLCPGDTLSLAPGTYSTGYLRFYPGTLGPTGIRVGTPTRPITINAADPSQPPLLRGGLQFTGAHYWRLANLRVEATGRGNSALYMNGGVGWSVRFSEFYGARTTGSYANVVIAGSGGQPRGFEFRGNQVHDAAISGRADATDHNVYVNFAGAAGSGGLITRNTIWGHPNGAGIKLGNGGGFNALGPWGVTVSLNTIASGGRQILLHGRVGYNVIYGNLFMNATQRFNANPRTTQIYVHDVTGRGNVFHHNYSYAATMFSYDPKHAARYGLGNVHRNTAAYNPMLRTTGAAVLVPANPAAFPYGATGTGRWR